MGPSSGSRSPACSSSSVSGSRDVGVGRTRRARRAARRARSALPAARRSFGVGRPARAGGRLLGRSRSFHGQHVDLTSSTSAPASWRKTPTAAAAVPSVCGGRVRPAPCRGRPRTASAAACTPSTCSAYSARASSASCAQSSCDRRPRRRPGRRCPSWTTWTSPSAVSDAAQGVGGRADVGPTTRRGGPGPGSDEQAASPAPTTTVTTAATHLRMGRPCRSGTGCCVIRGG